MLPSFAELKKSPKVDICHLVDSVKHIIAANQKERLFVKNINYEHIGKNASHKNVELTNRKLLVLGKRD